MAKPSILNKRNNVGQKKRNRKLRKKNNFSKRADLTTEGFTVIGKDEAGFKKKVERVLPDWLAHPSIIDVNLKSENPDLLSTSYSNLQPCLIDKLEKVGINHLFPVQYHVISWLLDPRNSGICYRPKDLCVSAPTGSGKTLTYVLPIIHKLVTRKVPYIRALVVLPVRDLAIQVYKVFQTYTSDTPLKVALLIGQKSFNAEQSQLIKKTERGFISQVDIVIATPGKLVDHLELTVGLCLHNLHYLVIDEADRMMDEVNQDWLSILEKKVQSKDCTNCYLCRADNSPYYPLTVNYVNQNYHTVQKLLFSATLSQNPEKLQKLKLFQPKLFTSVSFNSKDKIVSEKKGEFIGKFTTPDELQEFYIQCDIAMKPLLLFHLVQDLNFKRVVCFTNSVEAANRLSMLMSLMSLKVAEISSNLRNERRERIIKMFNDGKINILICSDVMARGMDFEDVDYIVSYDLPQFLKTYIHRVGRTARAGRKGTAVILLEETEVKQFQSMIESSGKSHVPHWQIDFRKLKEHESAYKSALLKASQSMKNSSK